jgi:hypothetical protein
MILYRGSAIAVAVATVMGVAAAAPPAKADWGHRGWHHYGYRPWGWAPAYYYPPPPVYYAPPPVVYAPPPPPVYYSPRVSLGLTIR